MEPDGTVTAVAPGIATITVTTNDGGFTATCAVTVYEQYSDVVSGAWYETAVQYVSARGLMVGTGSDKFSPNSALDRSMLVSILYRQAGRPEVTEASTFVDVPANSWFGPAVAWAQDEGIVYGVTETAFAPYQAVTREQMAAFFFRFAAYSGVDTSARAELDAFADANQVSNYAKEAIQWCVAEGILSGSNGELNPKDNATRAEFASIMMRYIENVVNA